MVRIKAFRYDGLQPKERLAKIKPVLGLKIFQKLTFWHLSRDIWCQPSKMEIVWVTKSLEKNGQILF